MLDFTRIIAGVAGQRETFEELVCQIARRLPPAGNAEFRRIHGAGGDGGVEAVWLLKTGEEVGYDLRSRYVHTGEALGGWIGPRFGNAERQVGQPVVPDRQMARILSRAPTFIGLERLTRLVLLRCAERLGAELTDAGPHLPADAAEGETGGADAGKP